MSSVHVGDARKACAVPGCQVRILRHLLMCPSHWREVAPAKQKKVYATWGAFSREGGRDAWDAYNASVADAVQSVEQRLADRVAAWRADQATP